MNSWLHTATWMPNWSGWLGWSNNNSCIGPPPVVINPSKCAELNPLGIHKSNKFLLFAQKSYRQKTEGGVGADPPLGNSRVKEIKDRQIDRCSDFCRIRTPCRLFTTSIVNDDDHRSLYQWLFSVTRTSEQATTRTVECWLNAAAVIASWWQCLTLQLRLEPFHLQRFHASVEMFLLKQFVCDRGLINLALISSTLDLSSFTSNW